jgi:hypothetical protein
VRSKIPFSLAGIIFVLLVCSGTPLHGQTPSGIAPCNIPIFIYPTGMGGLSTLYGGRPVILIDPPVAVGDPQFLQFTLFHECGHFAHRDVVPTGLVNRQGLRPQQELDADCYASKHVSHAISLHVADVFRQTQGAQSPAPDYPTGNERAANILRCAGISDDAAEDDDEAAGRSDASDRCPGLPANMSLVCRFTRGPRAGESENYCGTSARPAPIGGPCTDGRGSWGDAQ